MNSEQTMNPNSKDPSMSSITPSPTDSPSTGADHPADGAPFSPEQLTAWALGEDETLEQTVLAAIEAAYAADPATRAEADAVRATAALMSGELAGEPAGELATSQRAAILAAAGQAAESAASEPADDAVDNPMSDGKPAGVIIRPRWSDRLRSPGRLRWAAAAAATVAVVLLGGWMALRFNRFGLGAEYAAAPYDEVAMSGAAEVADLGGAGAPAAGLAAATAGINDMRMLGVPEAAMPTAGAGLYAGVAGIDEEVAADVAPTPFATALWNMINATPAPPGDGSVSLSQSLSEGGPRSAGESGQRSYSYDPTPTPNAEAYAPAVHNPFVRVDEQPLSTFSIDVDTASYANIRRFIQQLGSLPPADAVRIEEMINYFDYDYAPPAAGSEDPFAVDVAVADAPWRPGHRLVRIGIQGREIERAARPDGNLVFLVDVSGSMADPNKLDLVKQSLALLVEELGPRDRVAIVTYAGEAGLALPSTPGSDRRAILDAIDGLGAGGSTNGAGGIQQAYDVAAQHFALGGVNRVILATDGDFNVGMTSHEELQRLIEDEARRGIFLTALGYGMGNYKDATLELLADKGNGNYAYIDTLAEAKKVLVTQLSGTLVPIAKDVKIQVEFNPAKVAAYRLIGYENRMLAARDFDDDTKDAGEIGAGHSVTALYEIVPAGVPLGEGDTGESGTDEAAPLRYQSTPETGRDPRDVAPTPGADGAGSSVPAAGPYADELMLLSLRYKQPDGEVSRKIERPIRDDARLLDRADEDFRFAAAVAAFGMILRDSPHRGDATLDMVIRLAESALGQDPDGLRREFLDLVQAARGFGEPR